MTKDDAPPPGSSPRARPRRGVRGVVLAVTLLPLAGFIAAAGFVLYGSAGLPVTWVRGPLAAASERILGAGTTVSLSGARWEQTDRGPRLVLEGFDVRRGEGGPPLIAAPLAEIDVAPWSMLTGGSAVRSIDLVGLDLRVSRAVDGSLSLTAGQAETLKSAPPDAGDAGPLAAVAAGLGAVASPDGWLAGFDRLGLRRGKLTIEDATGGGSVTLDDVAVDLDRAAEGGRSFVLSARTDAGPVVVQARAKRGAAEVTLVRAPTAAVMALARLPGAELLTPMILSGTSRFSMSAEGRLGPIAGRLAVGPGRFLGVAPDIEPFDVDEVTAAFSLDPATEVLLVDELRFRGDGTDAALSARLTAAPDGRRRVEIVSGAGRLAAPRPGASPVQVDETQAVFLFDPATSALTVESMRVKGPGLDGSAEGGASLVAGQESVDLSVRAQGTDIDAALRLWPHFAATDVRVYIAKHLRKGRLETFSMRVTLDQAQLRAAFDKQPIPDSGLAIEAVASAITFAPLDGLPAIEGDEATGRFTGRTVDIQVPRASVRAREGQRLSLGDASLTVPDTAPKDAPARIQARLQGAAPVLIDLLRTDALKGVTGLDPATDITKGNVDLRLTLAFPLSRNLKASDVRMQAAGALSGLRVEGAVPNEAIEDTNLQISLDRGVTNLKGEGRVFGSLASIESRGGGRSAGGDLVLSFALDEASRAKRGLPSGRKLAGPVGVRVVQGPGKDAKPRVEIDLARAAIDGLVPGWTKPAGRAAKLSFLLARKAKGGSDLEDLVAESPGFNLKGSAGLDDDGKLAWAKLTQARLSPGDDARIDVERAGGGYRAVVRAQVFDARPFLRAVMAPGGVESDGADTPLDLDLRAAILTGYNSEAASNVDLKLEKRGGQLRRLELKGRFGRAPINGGVVRGQDGSGQLNVDSADAGAVFRFLDLYKRMVGGAVSAQLGLGERGDQEGVLVVRDFALRDEPALKRVLIDGNSIVEPSAERADRSGAPTPASTRGDVAFEKIRAEFARKDGRLELRDAVMWGPQIGVTIEGVVDLPRNQVNLTGTFVPAYALNNIFAKLPLVGILLGGGQYGGLFAANFRVSGQATAPTMTVNPLSVIAPGFLRKFFEFRRTIDEPGLSPAPAARSER